MLKFWDKQTALTLPNGATYTAEEIMNNSNWAFTKVVPTLIDEKGGITGAIENLYILKSVYGIDEALTDEEALVAINAAIEEARNPQPEGENI